MTNPLSEPIRLNKFLASAGIASRRRADQLIQEGRISINGTIQTEPGVRIIPGQDRVTLDGKDVDAPQNEECIYLLVNKPVHVVTTANDPEGRKTVLDLLPADLRGKRLFPVGRLDYMSEGLLLLTNDGDLTLKLTHPRFEHPKTYEVLVRGTVSDKALQIMRKGMRLKEGERLAAIDVTADSLTDKTMLHMTLRQGVNRQIRRMCRDLGLTILRLTRTAVGPLLLGDLAPAAWRHVRVEELSALRAHVARVSAQPVAKA